MGVKKPSYWIAFAPFFESMYLSAASSTKPAFLSSRKPLRTLNRGWPVLLAASSGVNAPSLSDLSVAIPDVVGFPSAEIHGILSGLGEFFLAKIPVFAFITFFEAFFGLLSGGGCGNNDGFAWFPVRWCSYFVFVGCLQGIN